GADEEACERTLEIAQATIEAWDKAGWAIALDTAERSWAAGELPIGAPCDLLATLKPEEPAMKVAGGLWLVPDGARPPPGAGGWAAVDRKGSIGLPPAEQAG